MDAEKLRRLSDAALNSGPDFSLAHLVDELAEISSAEEVALYDEHTGQIVRSGLRAGAIADEALRQRPTIGGGWSMRCRPFLSLRSTMAGVWSGASACSAPKYPNRY